MTLLPDLPSSLSIPHFSSQIALANAAKRLHAAIKERGKLSEEQSYECAILLIEYRLRIGLDEWIDIYISQAAEKTEFVEEDLTA